MLRRGQTLTYRSQKEGHEGVTDPQDPDVDDQEPIEDNPDDEGDEEQDNPDQPEQPNEPVDAATELAELKKLSARQGAELGLWRQGRTPRGQQSQPEPELDEGTDDGDDDRAYVDSLEQDSWRAAEALYGDTAIEAYNAAYPIYERAQTPADFIAAFEAYHDVRSKGGTTADAAAAAGTGTRRTRAEAVQPRVDSNRSDAGPDLNEKKLEEARKGNDLGAFVHAATTRMGFGGEKQKAP